ncbi:MAG: sigma 54-interacting transcriptional regulator [Desulfobulbaceae bacterium]|nr:sigma 54-interacting transcriptional regulator [Desulfobulbaceae bacterium]
MTELKRAKGEVERLGRNWQSLLDAMPGMVLLVGKDRRIVHQNRSAKARFGDLQNKALDQSLQDILALEPELFSEKIELVRDACRRDRRHEVTIGELIAECYLVPFTGYKGDELIMLLLRDISQAKRHEMELLEFHSNIETILIEKISELRASEENRKQLCCQLNQLKSQLGLLRGSEKIIGNSRKMRHLRDVIYQVAGSEATILITGESGTGKELVANMIHENSNRAEKPILKINCNAINDSVLESDLFGHEKGSFTGAVARRKGKFEIVDGGTIFLDEIGDISPKMQASLLRVLQNGEIVRVGGNMPIKVDVRVIAATNMDLAKAVEDKTFRLDLYYRLNIINIEIPPLRERKEDIIDLVSHFVKHYRKVLKKEIDFVPQSVINKLMEHEWPGNVRELENLIQRAVLMAKGKMITEQDLYFTINPGGSCVEAPRYDVESKLGAASLKEILAEFESEVIFRALKKYSGSVQRASKELRLGKTALYEKMKRYDISAKNIKVRA